MKKIFFLIISVLSFQTLSLADNIRYFQIEGMRIGDSALDYFSESQLEDNEQGWHNYSYKEYSTSFMQGKGIYNWFLVSYKNDDDNFIIKALAAGLEKNNYNNKECNNNLDVVALDISERFKNTTQEEKKSYTLKADAARIYPFTGKSTVTSLSFNFLDGAKIILACYNMDKEAKEDDSFLTSILNQNDSFRIEVRSSAFVDYLNKLNL
tara:strand:+ start:81 stop:707 length:627 start_codon:yes stop_codon:yes gene_type:complete